jgi:uncharacterized membrane protein YdfJ with MMPL/SSD domain
MSMSTVAAPVPVRPAAAHPVRVGPLGKLGRWTADHVRAVALAWAVLAVALGVFAPKVESALSGAGWQANGSESVQARKLIQANFAGLSSSALMVVLHAPSQTVSSPAFGPGAPGTLQIVAPSKDAAAVVAVAHRDPGIARVSPALPGYGGLALVQATPTTDPSAAATGKTIDRLRSALPVGALVGGAAAENHDLEQALNSKTPLVIGVVLALGFLLLLVALQAPLIAALGVATNLLATGAAFGIARLVFQNGHGAVRFGHA